MSLKQLLKLSLWLLCVTGATLSNQSAAVNLTFDYIICIKCLYCFLSWISEQFLSSVNCNIHFQIFRMQSTYDSFLYPCFSYLPLHFASEDSVIIHYSKAWLENTKKAHFRSFSCIFWKIFSCIKRTNNARHHLICNSLLIGLINHWNPKGSEIKLKKTVGKRNISFIMYIILRKHHE